MRFRTRERRKPVINIVSMVDILCILLIFLIVTTAFKKEEPAVQIDLPDSKNAKGTATELPTTIYVTDNDQVYLDTKPMPIGELESALKAQVAIKSDTKIALKASKKASFGLIIKVMDAAKASGIRQLPAYTEEPTK
jgi:biopolymer transport protein ExbD